MNYFFPHRVPVEDIDECATANPCVNGNCVNGIGDFTCACNHGWIGDLCEQAVGKGRIVHVYKNRGSRVRAPPPPTLTHTRTHAHTHTSTSTHSFWEKVFCFRLKSGWVIRHWDHSMHPSPPFFDNFGPPFKILLMCNCR